MSDKGPRGSCSVGRLQDGVMNSCPTGGEIIAIHLECQVFGADLLTPHHVLDIVATSQALGIPPAGCMFTAQASTEDLKAHEETK